MRVVDFLHSQSDKRIRDLEARATSLENKTSNLTTRVTSIEGVTASLKNRMTSAENKFLNYYTKSAVDSLIESAKGDSLPIGTIISYDGSCSNIPSGWELMNLSGRFLQGTTSAPGHFIEDGLPNITGQIAHGSVQTGSTSISYKGALFASALNIYPPMVGTVQTATVKHFHNLSFDASKSDPIYGRSLTVQPLAYTVCFIKKIS